MTKISILIPYLKKTEDLKVSLNAIRNQKVKDYEIFILNATDEKLQLLKNEKEIPVSGDELDLLDHFNRAITNSKGTYISFVYPGDKFSIDYFRILCLKADVEKLNVCRGMIKDYKGIQIEDTELIRKNKFRIGHSIFGNLYRKSFLFDNNLYFASNTFVFNYTTAFYTDNFGISNSAIYFHETKDDYYKKLRVQFEEWKINSLLTSWAIINFIGLVNIGEADYTNEFKYALDEILIKYYKRIDAKEMKAAKNCLKENLDMIEKCILKNEKYLQEYVQQMQKKYA